MSSRIKPSLHEVLNYPEESRRMLMQGFSDAVDRIAANNRRTDIELFQVCRALGEPNVPALLSLCDDAYRRTRPAHGASTAAVSANGQPPTRHTGRRRNHKPHMKVSHCFETADSHLA
jgi:hypothetical protein